MDEERSGDARLVFLRGRRFAARNRAWLGVFSDGGVDGRLVFARVLRILTDE